MHDEKQEQPAESQGQGSRFAEDVVEAGETTNPERIRQAGRAVDEANQSTEKSEDLASDPELAKSARPTE